MRIKRFNEDLGFDIDVNHDLDIKGYLIQVSDNNGYTSGYYSDTATYKQTSPSSPDKAKSFIDEKSAKEQDLGIVKAGGWNTKIVKASDILSSVFIVNSEDTNVYITIDVIYKNILKIEDLIGDYVLGTASLKKAKELARDEITIAHFNASDVLSISDKKLMDNIQRDQKRIDELEEYELERNKKWFK